MTFFVHDRRALARDGEGRAAYLVTRAETTNDCVRDVIENGQHDLRIYCGGYIAGGTVVLPQEHGTARTLANAGARLLTSITSLTGSCGRTACTAIGDTAQIACAQSGWAGATRDG